MIALLPLRGWAGEIMATQMGAEALHSPKTLTASSKAIATTYIANGAISTGAEGQFDHETMAVAVATTVDCPEHARPAAQGSLSPTKCHDCSICQAWHVVALELVPLADGLAPLLRQQPTFTPASFTSAERTLGVKPPIS